MTQFGSGWGWLALDGDTLKILKTPNGANPLVEGMTRSSASTCGSTPTTWTTRTGAGYVAAFLNHLVNWDEVAAELHKAV